MKTNIEVNGKVIGWVSDSLVSGFVGFSGSLKLTCNFPTQKECEEWVKACEPVAK